MQFRCETDCVAHPTACINEDLYKTSADALAADGVGGSFLASGYNGVHMDDCWMRRVNGVLEGVADRFPSGMRALGDYIHSKGVQYAIYTAESATTCAGYPASKGYETVDANTFASWTVDYLKVRYPLGCVQWSTPQSSPSDRVNPSPNISPRPPGRRLR